MTQTHQFAILYPLVIEVGAAACTIFVHALALAATVILFRHQRRLGRAGTRTLIILAIVTRAYRSRSWRTLIGIALWAVLLILCREFQEYGNAFYHSAVNDTTLSYGDLLLTPSWRLLGPLEAANGALVFGVSTAMVFAVIQGCFWRGLRTLGTEGLSRCSLSADQSAAVQKGAYAVGAPGPRERKHCMILRRMR